MSGKTDMSFTGNLFDGGPGSHSPAETGECDSADGNKTDDPGRYLGMCYYHTYTYSSLTMP
jgi:hypothetical protein